MLRRLHNLLTGKRGWMYKLPRSTRGLMLLVVLRRSCKLLTGILGWTGNQGPPPFYTILPPEWFGRRLSCDAETFVQAAYRVGDGYKLPRSTCCLMLAVMLRSLYKLLTGVKGRASN